MLRERTLALTGQEGPKTSPQASQASKGLRDPIWQFWGVLLGALAIGVIICLYYLQLPVKAISYGTVSFAPLVSVHEDVKGRLQLFFDKKPVPNVNYVLLRVVNSGNVPIQKQDIDKPVEFTLGHSNRVKVLSADVIGTSPKGIVAVAHHTETAVTLMPLLLNPNDTVNIRVLMVGNDRGISANARIVGVSQLTETDFAQVQENKFRLFNILVSTLVALLLIPLGLFVSYSTKARLEAEHLNPSKSKSPES